MKWNESLKNTDALEELWCEEKWKNFEQRLSQVDWSQATIDQELNSTHELPERISQKGKTNVGSNLNSNLNSSLNSKIKRVESNKINF